MRNQKGKAKCMDRRTFLMVLGILSLLGFLLRWTGIRFRGVDYEQCLEAWFLQLKEGGSLAALADFQGDYNVFYATILYFLTLLPVEPVISIKMVSILFDYLGAGVAMKMGMAAGEAWDNSCLYGAAAYGLVLCNPVGVINSGYLAQSEGIWASLALLSFWYIWQEKPVRGMWALGAALAMKLQSIFILPLILILYFYKKKFSILHLLWVPAAIQVLCIPAILGGCPADIAFRTYGEMLGEYPFLYYYYPNIWTFFKEAPYYQFGSAAVIITFTALLLFAVLFMQSQTKHTLRDVMEYAVWTTMTCAMLLPCMHERYNYMAELLLPVCALFHRKLRIPALVLVLLSMQCNGQSYLGWEFVSHYGLAAGNLIIYFYLTWRCFQRLYQAERREAESC